MCVSSLPCPSEPRIVANGLFSNAAPILALYSHLDGNQLSGSIPISFSNLKLLETLYATACELTTLASTSNVKTFC